jgi:hypothetical protein
MQERLKHLPEPVRRTLSGFYRRKRFYAFLRALLAPVICYAVVALVAMHVDRFVFLSASERLLLSVLTHGVSLMVGLISFALFAWRRLSVGALAYELERMLPADTQERVVTLSDLIARESDGASDDSASRAALLAQLTDETVALCEQTPRAGGLARDRVLRRRVWGLVVLGLMWGALLVPESYQFPLMVKRLISPRANLPKPSFVRLSVDPESPVIGRGGEVVLQVHVEGAIPHLLRRPLSWLGADSGVSMLATSPGRPERLPMDKHARAMSRIQRRLFLTSMGDLQESFSYRVRCGDAQTGIRFVQVVAQPRVTGITVQVKPPAYTRLADARCDDVREPVRAFAGSRVQLHFGSDQSELKSARVVNLKDGSTLADLEADPETGGYRHAFEMAGPVDMEIVLTNRLGFANVERTYVSMELREDEAPRVRMEYPAGDITAVQGDLIPVHVQLDDDLGLEEAAVVWQVAAAGRTATRPYETAIVLETNNLSQIVSTQLDLEKVGAIPGDLLTLKVRARDSLGSDAESQSVKIRVTAFAGNENERRRLAALRLVRGMLDGIVSASAEAEALKVSGDDYESILTLARSEDLVLDERPVPGSLIPFLEREHHFTDSAEAQAEVRMLLGVVAAQFDTPTVALPLGSRLAALKEVADEILPGLMRERVARDIVLRILSLRHESQALVATTGEGNPSSHSERRIDLLTEAIDNTNADLADLARMSEQIEVEELFAVTRQVSRACRDLKAGPSVAKATLLQGHIDGWVTLVQPVLPSLHEERRAARAALLAKFEEIRGGFAGDSGTTAGRQSGAGAVWLSRDAGLVERMPYLSLSERLLAVSSDLVTTNAAIAAALKCEADLLSEMAIEGEFETWVDGSRVTPPERRLAAALKRLDAAEVGAERASAAETLRSLDVFEEAAPLTGADHAAARGIYSHFEALEKSAGRAAVPHDEALEKLAAWAVELEQSVGGLEGGGGEPSVADMERVFTHLESELPRLEAEALRILNRMHLDLSYGDPSRPEMVRQAMAMPRIRSNLQRYQVVVPERLATIRAGMPRSRAQGELSMVGVGLDLRALESSLRAFSTGLLNHVKELWGEGSGGEKRKVRESAAAREIRVYYSAARELTNADNPAAVAADFFKAVPSAAAVVLDSHTGMLEELQALVSAAGESLRNETAASPTFREPMNKAVERAAEFGALLERFAFLDKDGSARALLANTHKRLKESMSQGRGADEQTLARDRFTVEELRRQIERLQHRTGEMIAGHQAAGLSGWRGGPAGIWSGDGRRDAEHTRSRIIERFKRARRKAALGFDAVLSRGKGAESVLPDEPLASALFAWRLFHSPLGGNATATVITREHKGEDDLLADWLAKEIDKMRKGMSREDSTHRYKEATEAWSDSAEGILRRDSNQ